MNNTYVIDASLSLAWILKEQVNTTYIENLFSDFAARKINAIAPTIWLYEMINGLKSAVIRKRITETGAKKKFPDILITLPELFDFLPLLEDSFQIATKHELSIYDASYIALAKRQRCKFYTGDDNLYKKVKDKIKFVKPISEY